MVTIKPIYLMAGGRSDGMRSVTRVMQAIQHEVGKEKPVIAYVGVAFGDNWGFYKMISGLMRRACGCQIERAIIAYKRANLDKTRRILSSADAIFMSGGDMEVGMQALQEKNMIDFFHELYQGGRLFFGASAGSIMLCREWVRWRNPDDDSTAELFPCLGFAPVMCDTHAEEDNWEELKVALALKQDGAVGYGIPSGATLKVSPDGNLEALGGSVTYYSKANGSVKKQPNLKPSEKQRST